MRRHRMTTDEGSCRRRLYTIIFEAAPAKLIAIPAKWLALIIFSFLYAGVRSLLGTPRASLFRLSTRQVRSRLRRHYFPVCHAHSVGNTYFLTILIAISLPPRDFFYLFKFVLARLLSYVLHDSHRIFRGRVSRA